MTQTPQYMSNNRKNELTTFALLRAFLRGSAPIFALSMIFAALVSFLDMVGPRLISFTVDSVIGDKPPQLPAILQKALDAAGGVEVFRKTPFLVALIVIAVALLAGICRFLFRYLNGAAAEKFVKNMRDRLYEKIERMPYAWHGQNSTGDIIQRCTSDVENIKVFVSEQLTSLVRVVVLILLAVGFMLAIDPLMTLIASIFIPTVIGYSLFFYSRIGSAFEKADAQEGRLSAIAQENLTGVRVVRAFGREHWEQERFSRQNTTYTGFWIHLMKILTLNWVAGDIMTGTQYLLVTVMGTVFCVNGRITAGQFIAFFTYNAMLTWPVRSLGRVISEMSKAHISLERLRYIMASPEEPQVLTAGTDTAAADTSVAGALRAETSAGDSTRTQTAATGSPEIRFEHVSFTYPGTDKKVLDDVSFTIPGGSVFGILGATGSGKSTLMYLLERLYTLEEGEGRILIDGTDIRSIPASKLRSQIGMVLQEPFLFSRSLEENIKIAAPQADEDALKSAARTADLADTIDSFPAGYDTFVGERGVTLSGGQKQRTAIAQMLIRECPVMIFDDSLSAVDAGTDERIRQALRENTAGATVILIAHRVMTLMRSDHIIVLDGGRIVQSGTHAQLMQEDGIYRTVYNLQTGNGGDADAE